MINDVIRLILVDDHKMIRDSWKMLLENNSRIQVIGECDNSLHALELSKELLPDILLVDLNMTPVTGYNLTEQIGELLPTVKVIGISVSNQPKYASRMLSLGAKGYLTKTSSLEEIHHGIHEVKEGRIYICEEIRKLISEAS
jgi:two-component system, NarL family, invasion response regulator UvrY